MSREALPATNEERLHGDYWKSRPGGGVELTALGCTQCGTAYLPRTMSCAQCGGRSFAPVPLSSVGDLYSYTIIHGAGGVWPPVYAVGYVDFPEGVRVFAQIRETDPERLSIGAKVTVEEAVLYTRKDGTAVTSFRFRLADGVQK